MAATKRTGADEDAADTGGSVLRLPAVGRGATDEGEKDARPAMSPAVVVPAMVPSAPAPVHVALAAYIAAAVPAGSKLAFRRYVLSDWSKELAFPSFSREEWDRLYRAFLARAIRRPK